MTSTEFNAAVAKFTTRAEAKAAADQAMPRRKHNRPYPQFVGAYDAWTVMAYANIVLMSDGSMYNHQRNTTVAR